MVALVLAIGGMAVSAVSVLWVLSRSGTAVRRSSPILASMILVRRLVTDRRVPFLPKALLAVPIVYEISPVQLIPNFVPVLGQLDNLIVLGICLRLAARSVPGPLLAELWPGPDLPSLERHQLPWHRFHFWPLPQVQRSLRPREASSDA